MVSEYTIEIEWHNIAEMCWPIIYVKQKEWETFFTKKIQITLVVQAQAGAYNA